MRPLTFLLAVLFCGTANACIVVTDAAGNPLSTGMSWDINRPRVTNAQILASSLGPKIISQDWTVIRPRDIGDDSPEDDTELLRWSLLVSHVLQVPLYIDRQYGYSALLEVQENQTVYGNGPHAPGLKMLPSVWFANPVLSGDKSGVPTILHAPGVKRFTIRDLQIDGAQYEVDWAAVQQYDADAIAANPSAKTVSQFLRESPSWAGIAPTIQDGRSPLDELTLENVHVHDTPGTCLFGMARMHCRNLTLGNSVSGRILYRFSGECVGLHTYGFSRSSVARVNAPCVISNWTYRGEGHVNPWAENDQPTNIVAIERTADSKGTVDLRNVDWDGADSVFAGCWGFKVAENCRVSGEIRNLKSFCTTDVNRGPFSIDVDLRTENSEPPNLSIGNLANVRDATIRFVNRTTDDLKSNHDWSYTPAGHADWNKCVHDATPISVARKPWHAADHEQRIDLHIDNDWPQTILLHFPDLAVNDGGTWRLRTAEEVIPTYVRLSGRIDNRAAVWIGTQPGWTQQYVPQAGALEALPIRVVIDALNCNEIPPGAFRSDYPWTIHAGMLSVRDRWPLSSTVGVP